jgi:hypothetical protein
MGYYFDIRVRKPRKNDPPTTPTLVELVVKMASVPIDGNRRLMGGECFEPSEVEDLFRAVRYDLGKAEKRAYKAFERDNLSRQKRKRNAVAKISAADDSPD